MDFWVGGWAVLATVDQALVDYYLVHAVVDRAHGVCVSYLAHLGVEAGVPEGGAWNWYSAWRGGSLAEGLFFFGWLGWLLSGLWA